MKISDHTQSIILILIRYLLYTVSFMVFKLIGENDSLLSIIFIKYTLSFLLFFPVGVRQALKIPSKKATMYHILNIGLMLITIPMTYYGYRGLTISLSTSISFTMPLFAALFSVFFLKESLKFKYWFFIILGYLGVIIMITPIEFDKTKGVVSLLLANIFASFIMIIRKKLMEYESEIKILFYSYSGVSLCLGIAFIFYGKILNSRDLALVSCQSILTVIYQYAGNRALRIGRVSKLAPFEYSRMIFVLPISLFIFKDDITLKMILGSILIVVSNYFISGSKK